MDRQFTNVVLLGISFLLIFTSFQTGSMIQVCILDSQIYLWKLLSLINYRWFLYQADCGKKYQPRIWYIVEWIYKSMYFICSIFTCKLDSSIHCFLLWSKISDDFRCYHLHVSSDLFGNIFFVIIFHSIIRNHSSVSLWQVFWYQFHSDCTWCLWLLVLELLSYGQLKEII